MLKFGKQVFKLESVDSTNNFAANLINEGLADNGAVVMADFQTNGRGQRSNSWESDAGMNLTASFIYFPANLTLSEVIHVNWWVSMGIINCLNGMGIKAKIKWPNDIYVNDCKLGGVLIETTNQSNAVKSVIIGVGINLNQTVFNRQNATSIKKLRGTFTKTEDVLWMLCDSLTRYENELGDYNLLKESYENNLYRLREKSPFQLGNQRVEGEIIGVSSQGQLKIRIADEVQLVEHGQLTWIFQ
jgi:BirA family biotin operon repressor/biotin-[acetyl-CoA-carboxylase] ligase